MEWDSTYYGNRYSFAFPSPDCKAATKKKKSTVEKNVYAGQITATMLKKIKRKNKKRKTDHQEEKKEWIHSILGKPPEK